MSSSSSSSSSNALERVPLRLTLMTEQRALRHRVQVFEQGQTHAVSTFTLVPGRETSVVVVRVPGPARPWLVRWYTDTAYVDGIEDQSFVAGGTPSRLIDVDGREHGKLHGLPGRAKLQVPPMGEAEAMIKKVRAVHLKLGARHEDTVLDVDVLLDGRMRPMPILWYALSAVQMRADPAHATQLFEHWVCVVERFRVRQASDHDRLADLVALPSLAWPYRPDTTPDGREADCWSSVWATADPHLAAVDCEDGAKACLEIFHVLQTTELVQPSARLRRIQALARKYTPYLGVVQLRSSDGSARESGGGGGDFIMHCFLVLLASEGDEPSISVEPTDYASGVWRLDSGMTLGRDERVHDRATDLAEHQKQSAMARVRVPMSMVRDRGLYGRLYSLVTASAAGGFSEHRVCHDGKAFGVDLEHFMLARSMAFTTMAVCMPTRDLARMFEPHMAFEPRAVFPLAPPTLSQLTLPSATDKIEFLVARGTDVHLTSTISLGYTRA